MADDARPSLLIYQNLIDDEQAKLEVHEREIATLLVSSLGIQGGARWTGIGEGIHRIIQLIAPNRTPPVIFEISGIDLAEQTSPELMSEIAHAIRKV